jgi:hypothetical protein
LLIIAAARRGEIDPLRLREIALSELSSLAGFGGPSSPRRQGKYVFDRKTIRKAAAN